MAPFIESLNSQHYTHYCLEEDWGVQIEMVNFGFRPFKPKVGFLSLQFNVKDWAFNEDGFRVGGGENSIKENSNEEFGYVAEEIYYIQDKKESHLSDEKEDWEEEIRREEVSMFKFGDEDWDEEIRRENELLML